MCVHVCVYIYIYIYTYMHIHNTYTHTCSGALRGGIYIYIHMYAYMLDNIRARAGQHGGGPAARQQGRHLTAAGVRAGLIICNCCYYYD